VARDYHDLVKNISYNRVPLLEFCELGCPGRIDASVPIPGGKLEGLIRLPAGFRGSTPAQCRLNNDPNVKFNVPCDRTI